LSRFIITSYGYFNGYHRRTREPRPAPRHARAAGFRAIYILWGATFLAIRIAVLEIPPFFSSGVRFLIAGALLYVFMRLRGQPSPSAREWRSIATNRAVHVRRDLRRALLG